MNEIPGHDYNLQLIFVLSEFLGGKVVLFTFVNNILPQSSDQNLIS